VSGQAWEVLRLLNIYRMERGLQPLSTFAAVQEAANIRAKELFVHCSHTRPNGAGYETVFAEVGVPALSTRITSWAENIASGQKSAADVMNSWKASPGHNANMLKPSGRVHVGIGYDYQTNGNPSLYASNWVQNFAAAYDCCFTNLQLSRSAVEGKPGTDLETLLKEAGIEVTADCYRHGRCSLPLIAAMCRGYDAGSTAEQELTVAYGGQTAVLTVTGSGHTHSWTETMSPAACTASGSRTLTCAGCGGTKVEVIPALGHSFALQPDGAYVCASCSASVPAGWKTAYEELTEDAETNKLQYPHGEEGVDIEASEAAIQNYLERQTAAVLRNSGIDETAFDCVILDGAFNEEHTRYGYRIGITAAESPELQPFSMLRAYRAEDYILETEPLVLFLNVGSSDNSIFDEAPDVATPGGNVSVDDPSTPPEPQPPSVPSDPYIPSRPSGGTGSAAATVYQIAAPQTDGGRVSLSPSSASRGQRVTISAHPDSGYVLDSLRVTDAGGNEVPLRDLGDGTYEFTMPGSQVALTAAFKKMRTEPALNPAPLLFSDVSSADWFYSSVDYVWKHYLMSGVSGTQFAPGGTTSRAMLWTILARMHGASAGAAPGEAWYTGGQLWAVQQNISDGTAPMGDVTREQIAAMLWRDAGSPQAAADLSGFRDGGLVSGYAQAAMRWAVETGIMQGADGMLRPQSTATRAEMAAMITRYAVQAG
ncbi:MAG: S-layer homology domain-containing protein, partial [Oscillospiraceae bacterium]|nr:S-layer homology domain-containing protein [Oscillospiraceae bacterium]